MQTRIPLGLHWTRSLLLFFFLLCASVHTAHAQTTTLIPLGASWRYRDNGTDQGTAWRAPTFNDQTWPLGPAELGYGDGDEATVVGFGTTSSSKYTTTYFRHTFVVSDPSEYGYLSGGVTYDDGAVVYLNGQEILRVNLPSGTIATGTFANSASEYTPAEFSGVLGNRLLAGNNVLAVEIHQGNRTSSDISFDFELVGHASDFDPPTISSIDPSAGALSTLNSITVTFSEDVAGVTSDDLLLNGLRVDAVSGGPRTYTFTFPQPLFGLVDVTWSTDHNITDRALPPNPFDGDSPASSWSYDLVDNLPPTVVSLTPFPNMTVRSLTQVEAQFSEPVVGVDATDLLINGQPADGLEIAPGVTYIFAFSMPPDGPVQVAWAASHGIADLADNPNAFVGGSWTYDLDPSAPAADLALNEISAANVNGLVDEFGNAEDWIEIRNRGSLEVDLAGWSLSDENLLPGKWVFPPYPLAPGEHLVVFASGRDIKTPTRNNKFHTNFKLGNQGEELGLYSPDSPRRLSPGIAGSFPEQRNDHSYGLDSLGDLRYFAAQTPGYANGHSTITGVVSPVHLSVQRGYFDQPFQLVLTSETPGAEIRYTADGSEPRPTTGRHYQTPLTIIDTTLLRAAAFRTGLLPSRVATHSYLFNLPSAFRSLPVISLVTEGKNLWGPTGILGINGGNFNSGPWAPNNPGDPNEYHNPQRSLKQNDGGALWERPISIEWIEAGNGGFHTDAGLRVHGSNWTRPRYRIGDKFAFKVYFRSDYGPSRLNFPWFPGSVDDNLDEVVLRDGHNDGRNPFIIDELMRRLHGDMGQVASHGTFGNLLLNGVPMIQRNQPENFYFNPINRVKEGFLQAWHGGGLEWDIIGPFGDSQGGGDRINWNAFESFMRNQSNTASTSWYEEVGQRLDLESFVDYLLVNIYGATWDWPQNNWRAARERTPNGIWRFYVWDAEGAFYTHNSRSSVGPSYNNFTDTNQGLADNEEIATFYQRLRGNPEFRLLFADRIQKHFFNEGALTEAHVTDRFNEMRTLLSQVIVSMDARIVNNWVPNRRGHLWDQFTDQGLLAPIDAPTFSRHGGQVARGFQLTVTGPAGSTLYTTIDGTDPRVKYSGAVASTAIAMAPGNTLTIDQSVTLKARARNGSLWSALTEAHFEAGFLGTPLRITEIMYNPSGGNSAHEFLEIQNLGTTALDLSGLSFEGVTLTFPDATFLAPDALIVLSSDSDPAAFASRYPGVTVAGRFAGALANGGERIAILDRDGNTIVSVDYRDDDGWPVQADGGGASLEIIDPLGAPDEPANWQASSQTHGSPGGVNPAAPSGTVLLNEILAENLTAVPHGNTFPDWIELYNPGPVAADLSGWSMTDDGNPRKFVFPANTSIPAQGYLVVWCDSSTNNTPGLHTDLALGRNGDNLFLYSDVTNRVDALSFGQQVPDLAIGRVDGNWTLTAPTPLAPNVAVPLGAASNLSLNEWMANPVPGEDDWVELYNRSATHPVSLQGLYLAAGGATHPITSLAFVSPKGFALFRADQNDGPDHLDFKMPAIGGDLRLYDPAAVVIDQVSYAAQSEGVSQGRLPDGSATIDLFNGSASPGAPNYRFTYTGPIINEILARNQTSAADLNGSVADCVELYNPRSVDFDLTGMSLSVDEMQPGQWSFPIGTGIPAQGYLVVWCDGENPASTTAGPVLNLGRSLDGASGGVYLFNPANQRVDSVEYGFQLTDQSIGRVGVQWRLLDSPTIGTSNGGIASFGDARRLRLNEWMADPDKGDDWFEVYNPEPLPVELHNLVVTDDPSLVGRASPTLTALSYIGPHNWIRIEASGRRGQGGNHVGFSLDSLGDTLRIYASNGSLIDSVHFGRQRKGVSQGRLLDGQDVLVNFESTPTPQAANYLPTQVIVNEVLTHTDPPLEDAIELHNPTAVPADISGCYLSDDWKNLKKYRIPGSTVVPAGGFQVIYEDAFNDGSANAFALSSARGGTVWLSAADSAGNLTGDRARLDFDPSANGVSMGPHATPFGTDVVPLSQLSFGADSPASVEEFRTGPGQANAAPRTPDVVINEIMYHPPDQAGTGGSEGNTRDEYVELSNQSAQPVNLFDPAHPTNTWRLRGGVEFNFPEGVIMPANGYAVVVSFDPVADPASRAAFVQAHALSGGETILGPLQGSLANAGETVRLLKPDTPQAPGAPDAGTVPYLLEDRVSYLDESPWPAGAVDGGGLSLQKQTPEAYGNNPLQWVAGTPTPGTANGLPIVPLPRIIIAPANQSALPTTATSFRVQATGTGPLTYQWRHEGRAISGATTNALALDYVTLEDYGDYDVLVGNAGGTILSPAASLRVSAPPEIIVPPQSQTTIAGSDATFSVTISGTPPPFRYQWTYGSLILKDVVLQEETCFLTITNVSTNDDDLSYRIAIANDASPDLSDVQSTFTLTVLEDTDLDGLPDAFEAALGFPDLSLDGDADDDSDGLTNREEYLAGTDLLDPLSYLRVDRLSTYDGISELEFVAVSNRSYSVQYQIDLSSAQWDILTNTEAHATNRTVVIQDSSSSSPARLYRLITPAQQTP